MKHSISKKHYTKDEVLQQFDGIIIERLVYKKGDYKTVVYFAKFYNDTHYIIDDFIDEYFCDNATEYRYLGMAYKNKNTTDFIHYFKK